MLLKQDLFASYRTFKLKFEFTSWNNNIFSPRLVISSCKRIKTRQHRPNKSLVTMETKRIYLQTNPSDAEILVALHDLVALKMFSIIGNIGKRRIFYGRVR